MNISTKFFVMSLSLSYLIPALADCSISSAIIGTNSSFMNSCSDCGYNSDTGILAASCTNQLGKQTMTSIIAGECLQGIENNGGELWCEGNQTKIHSGSYRASCEDIQASGRLNTTIQASCKTTNRYPTYIPSSINISTCPVGDLANKEGQLTCGSPP